MELDRDRMISKYREEVRNLEERKEMLPAKEREFVDTLADALRTDLDKIQRVERVGEFLDENEKMTAQATITEVMNDLDFLLREIETATRARPSLENATEYVEQFFVACQIAENVIKFGGLKGHFSAEQRQDLNRELKDKVDRMIQLSRKSEVFDQALLQSRVAQKVIAT